MLYLKKYGKPEVEMLPLIGYIWSHIAQCVCFECDQYTLKDEH